MTVSIARPEAGRPRRARRRLAGPGPGPRPSGRGSPACRSSVTRPFASLDLDPRARQGPARTQRAGHGVGGHLVRIGRGPLGRMPTEAITARRPSAVEIRFSPTIMGMSFSRVDPTRPQGERRAGRVVRVGEWSVVTVDADASRAARRAPPSGCDRPPTGPGTDSAEPTTSEDWSSRMCDRM